MKTRIIFFLAITAIITLSFSFVSTKKSIVKVENSSSLNSAPIGGFVVEDGF